MTALKARRRCASRIPIAASSSSSCGKAALLGGQVLHFATALAEACVRSRIHVAGARVQVPGSRVIRLSVVGGNRRVHRLIDRAAGPGAIVVDVGAHVGYNTIYASRRVGPSGRVVAIEPAADNLRILRENVAINGIANIVVEPVAAGAGGASRH